MCFVIISKDYVASGFSHAGLLKINQSDGVMHAGFVKEIFHLMANLKTFKLYVNEDSCIFRISERNQLIYNINANINIIAFHFPVTPSLLRNDLTKIVKVFCFNTSHG